MKVTAVAGALEALDLNAWQLAQELMCALAESTRMAMELLPAQVVLRARCTHTQSLAQAIRTWIVVYVTMATKTMELANAPQCRVPPTVLAWEQGLIVPAGPDSLVLDTQPQTLT